MGNTKTFADLGLRHGAAEASYLCDFVGVQEFFEEGNQASVDRVLFVHPVVGPFKIGGDWVRLHTVNMVDDRQVGWVRNEGECDESMDEECFASAVSVKTDLQVSEFVNSRPQYFAVASLRAVQSNAQTVNASDLAKVADLVGIFEGGDRDWSPFFVGNGNHVTGGPSGDIGSAIKSPSHAATFGGFAIMAALSEAYKGRLHCPSH